MSKNLFVLPAPTVKEDLFGKPFSDFSTLYLKKVIEASEYAPGDFEILYLFPKPFPQDKFENVLEPKQMEGEDRIVFEGGKVLKRVWANQLMEFRQSILDRSPALVIPLGKIPLWALGNTTKIQALRGTLQPCVFTSIFQLFPTHDPKMCIFQGALKPFFERDIRLSRTVLSQGAHFEGKRILVPETVEEVERLFSQLQGPLTAVDLELYRGRISMIGFSDSPTWGFVVPFVRLGVFPGPFFDLSAEIGVRYAVQAFLSDPTKRKVFQNGAFDIQFLHNEGFELNGWTDDTLYLAHHLASELPRSLDSLATLYTNQNESWKETVNFKEKEI